MRHANEERFEDFFEEDRYVALKNHLYNYVLRKRLISSMVVEQEPELTLEVGSGLSPMITGVDNVVYSELSHRALSTLRDTNGRGYYVVADCTRLPFKDGAFGATVCSEVLEHVEDDEAAIKELARVMSAGGHASITVPHRQFYFAADDRYVRHFRRYELADLLAKLEGAGLEACSVRKVLGPFEKVVMFSTVMVFSFLQGLRSPRKRRSDGGFLRLIGPLFKWVNLGLAGIAWLDAKVMPRALATVIFVDAGKSR